MAQDKNKQTAPAAPAPAPSTALAVPQDVMALYEADKGTGFENAGQQDFAIPFVKLLQKLSPECDEAEDGYVEGAKPGMFWDAGAGKLLPELRVIPCHYRRAVVEWKPDRKGFVAQHDPAILTEKQWPTNDKGVPVNDAGNLLVDTRYYFVQILDEDDEPRPGVLSFSSSQIKKSKQWLTRMQAMKIVGKDGKFTPPMFSHIWKITSGDESNDKGSWKVYKIEIDKPVVDADLFSRAKESREMFQTAEVRPLLTAGEEGPSGDSKM